MDTYTWIHTHGHVKTRMTDGDPSLSDAGNWGCHGLPAVIALILLKASKGVEQRRS